MTLVELAKWNDRRAKSHAGTIVDDDKARVFAATAAACRELDKFRRAIAEAQRHDPNQKEHGGHVYWSDEMMWDAFTSSLPVDYCDETDRLLGECK